MTESRQEPVNVTICDVCSAQYPRGEVRCGECKSYRKDVRRDLIIARISSWGGVFLPLALWQYNKIKSTTYWTRAQFETDAQIFAMFLLLAIISGVISYIHWQRVYKRTGSRFWF
jgi:hypothetical protein